MGNFLRRTIVFAALLLTITAQANVVISGTRIIYNADENEATIRLNNNSVQPSLVQVWLDSGDMKSTPETGLAPFIATPPIFRVEPNKSQTVRLIYTHDPLPQDRESVFWLNILDVPPMPITKEADDANYMQLAIRSRIKLFYRPKNLPGSAPAAADQVKWELVHNPDGIALRATNNAVYSVSMDNAVLVAEKKEYTVNTEMLLPLSSKTFSIQEVGKLPGGTVQLNYATVNDYGAVIAHSVNLPQ